MRRIIRPAEEISKLKQGNGCYTNGNPQHPRQTIERRSELAKGEPPFAIIVSCSDSRVPPEIIFDQGLGNLYVAHVWLETSSTVKASREHRVRRSSIWELA